MWRSSICWRVFEEKVFGKLARGRPGLAAALAELREGDMIAVVEVDRLSRDLLEGLIMLQEPFDRGVRVKVLEGVADGEHIERSFLLDIALALADDQRRDISRRTRDGLVTAALPYRRPAFRHHDRPIGPGPADARWRHELAPYWRSPRHRGHLHALRDRAGPAGGPFGADLLPPTPETPPRGD